MQTILVIEDEALLREDLLEVLDMEGFQAIGAKNGREGVRLARNLLPDLILCDVLMPELDGYGVLSMLRQKPETALIPFVFLTAKGTVDDFRQGMKLGADDYLIKPYKQTELLETISTRLTKRNAILQLQKAAMIQLQQKIEELQQTNLMKDDFLSTASHELRAPMTNIMMVIQLLRRDPLDDRQQRYLSVLQAECSREIELINDLLDLQRLEASTYPLELETFVLQDWVPAIAEPFQTRAQERQQIIQVQVAAELPPFLSDAADLKRILMELMNNACKYTPPGGIIALSVYSSTSLHSPADAVTAVTFTVSNEAEIPAEALPHLFNRFYRVPQGDRWQQGGTGLGLALVQKLVERLGGSIQVTSESGWTQFTIEIPTTHNQCN